jgi:hypothetical protein
MKRLIPLLSVLAVTAFGALAPSVLAYTEPQALARAEEDAQNKWGGTATIKECVNSGKNQEGVAQWYCNGTVNFSEEWKINLDPYGTITYEKK